MRLTPDACSRRHFCKKVSQLALTAGTAAACGLGSCKNRLDEKFTTVTLDLTQPDYTVLQQPTGIAYASADLIIVYRASTTTVYAFSSICTHAGCLLPIPESGFLPADGVITCPCHGSIFSTQGVVLKGPALRDLPSYYTVLSGTTLTISSAPPASA
jgi:Rieske Fe-S protein